MDDKLKWLGFFTLMSRVALSMIMVLFVISIIRLEHTFLVMPIDKWDDKMVFASLAILYLSVEIIKIFAMLVGKAFDNGCGILQILKQKQTKTITEAVYRECGIEDIGK